MIWVVGKSFGFKKYIDKLNSIECSTVDELYEKIKGIKDEKERTIITLLYSELSACKLVLGNKESKVAWEKTIEFMRSFFNSFNLVKGEDLQIIYLNPYAPIFDKLIDYEKIVNFIDKELDDISDANVYISFVDTVFSVPVVREESYVELLLDVFKNGLIKSEKEKIIFTLFAGCFIIEKKLDAIMTIVSSAKDLVEELSYIAEVIEKKIKEFRI